MPGTSARALLVEKLQACRKCNNATRDNIAFIVSNSGKLSDEQVDDLLVYLERLHEEH